jgi:hypothetical protein
MSEAREALRELAGLNKTKRMVQAGAAATADYLDELLGKQQGDITLPRDVVIGMKSVLRSASKDHGGAR